MPFPFAHPAAVLPLRRFCPRLLSFPALVAGSLCPDLGYAFRWLELDKLAHGFLGSFVFCLPVGLLVLHLFVRSRVWLVRRLPYSSQAVLWPLCGLRLGSPGGVLFSLLVGAWTHLLLDSFTNQRGEAAVFFDVLQLAIGSVAGHEVRICHCLWYGLSFAGVAWLLLAYEKWMVRTSTGAVWRPLRLDGAKALLLAGLVLPMGALHHLTSGWTGGLLVAGLSVGWGWAVVTTLRGVLAGAREKGRWEPGDGDEPVPDEGVGHPWLVRKACWVPTRRCWIVLVLSLFGGSVLVLRSMGRFLAVTEPVAAEVLVVEGWIPDYAMPGVMAEFQRGGYRLLVASGGEASEWWSVERYKTWAEITVATLVAMGFDTNRIVAAPPDRGVVRDRTYSSGLAVKHWLQGASNTVHGVNVYSLGAHARRSRLLFRKAIGASIRVGIIAHPDETYDSSQWWANADGFTETLCEGLAYLYARVLFEPGPEDHKVN